MKGKLINFEGIDSSGKKTQSELLAKRLIDEGKEVEIHKFPTYETTKLGEYVSRYLTGEFGSKEKVNPYLGSLFYSIDRLQFREEFFTKLNSGIYLIVDRYIPSNIFQAAKFEGDDRFKVWEWIKTIETPLPKQDAIILLNVPATFSQSLFSNREQKNILVKMGKKDIHEADLVYQQKVGDLYLEIAKREGWIIINCCKKKAPNEYEFRPKLDIHDEIYRNLKQRNII